MSLIIECLRYHSTLIYRFVHFIRMGNCVNADELQTIGKSTTPVQTIQQTVEPKVEPQVEPKVVPKVVQTKTVEPFVSYFIPVSYRDHMHNDCFEITNLPLVKEQISAIKKDELIKSTCTDHSKVVIDETKRKSMAASRVITVDVLSKVYKSSKKEDEFITVNPYFEYIEYQTGGFFARHTDKDRPHANATVLIYPPQTIEGGELVVCLGGYKDDVIFKPLPDKWTIVIFPNGKSHESKIVTSGTKVVLKGVAFINYANPVNQRVVESRAGLED